MSYVFIGDLHPYQEDINGKHKAQYQRLLTEADRCSQFTLPKVHPSESTTYMGIAIVNLALAYRLSGEKKYLDHALRFMRTVLSYEKWGNAHLVNVDLSASWILFGLSLGYDWLREDLDAGDRRRMITKIHHHADIIFQYRRSTYGEGWATNFYQNHNWINMTGLAAAGYVLEKEGMDGKKYTQEARKNFDRVYSLLPEDGSNYEGVVYWRYGGMWLFVYAHLLKTQEGINLFASCPYLKNTFYYRLYQSAGDLRQQLNFGDCHDRHSGHTACVYYKTAAEYNDGYAQNLGNLVVREFLTEEAAESKVKPGILPEAAFEFLWYDPAVQEKPLEELPLRRFFPDLGLLALRSGWDQNAKVLTIKCSAPGGNKQWRCGWQIQREEQINLFSLSHHHPDNLSYIYAEGGDFLTCEDGYNRNLMPDNHNVLLVDGQYCDAVNVNDAYMASVRIREKKEPFQPSDFTGIVTGCIEDGDVTLYRGENHLICPKALRMTEVSRLLITDGLKYWVFVDVFRSSIPHMYSILSNTDCRATRSGSAWRYPMPQGEIVYQVFSDHQITARQYPQTVSSVMTTQEPDKVCKTQISTLAHDSEEKQTEQIFIECFTRNQDQAQVHRNDNIWCLSLNGEMLAVRPGEIKQGLRSIQVCFTRNGTDKTYEM